MVTSVTMQFLSDGRMIVNSELERIRKEAVVSNFKVLSLHLRKNFNGNHEKI
jgi:hypothetical protein